MTTTCPSHHWEKERQTGRKKERKNVCVREEIKREEIKREEIKREEIKRERESE
jgi:hypothetical protein